VKRHNAMNPRIVLLLFLFLLLPALACNTLAGGDDAATAVPDAQQATQAGPDDEPDSPDSGGGETASGEADSSAAAPATGETSQSGEESTADSSAAGSSDDDGGSSTAGDGDTGAAADAGSSDGESGSPPAGGGESGDSSASSSGDQSGNGPTGDTRETVVGALSSSMEEDAMRITLSNNVAGLENVTVLEFVRPDRYHLIGQGVEFIIIGDSTYIKGDGSDWIQSPAAMGDSVQPLVDQMLSEAAISQDIDELVGSIDDVQFLGSETLNGVDTLMYEYTQITPDGTVNQTSRIWIGASDGRLYRQEVSGVFGGQSIDSSIQYEYGSDIVIEPPL